MGILAEIRSLGQEMTAWRHHLHANPELSGYEANTAVFLEKTLTSFGLTPIRLGDNGVVATLHGKTNTSGKAIILRADTDALPIAEDTGLPYASTNHGVMHACGHDGHMAMLLGAAKYLSQHPGFDGTVHFLFQPAEETGRGAAEMIKAGLFEKFPADAVYGLHNTPVFPLGMMGTRKNDMLSASDGFIVTLAPKNMAPVPCPDGTPVTITLTGDGAHASDAKKATDLLSIAAKVVTTFKSTLFTTNIETASTVDNVLSNRVDITGVLTADTQKEITAFAKKRGAGIIIAPAQEIPDGSRRAAWLGAAVTIGQIKDNFEQYVTGGDKGVLVVTAVNAAPDGGVNMLGTFRSFQDQSQQQLKAFLESSIQSVADDHGLTGAVGYDTHFPTLHNADDQSDTAIKAARQVVGLLRVVTKAPQTLGTEDFAYLLKEKDGNYMAMGTGPWRSLVSKKGLHGLHSAKFDFNDKALPIGASYWAKLAQTALPAPKSQPKKNLG